MSRLTADLRRLGVGASSLVEVAERTTASIHGALRLEGGGPASVLTRFFRTCTLASLDAPARDAALAQLGGTLADQGGVRTLTLLATVGAEPAWNDRLSSRSHLAIPLPDPAAVERLPMIAHLIRQLGYQVGEVLEPDRSILLDVAGRPFGIFLVEDAVGSAFVPAQDFVRRYGVRSVLGFGGMFPNGELFVSIAFLRVRLETEVAELFQPLTFAVKVASLPFLDFGA